MARKNIYRGFSSFEFQKNKSFRLTDIELVKMDLMNHIFTRKGDRVMMPNFGTSIPDLVFEPLDQETLSVLEDELNTVFQYDPRVDLLEMRIDPLYDQNAVTVYVKLNYVEIEQVDELELQFEFSRS